MTLPFLIKLLPAVSHSFTDSLKRSVLSDLARNFSPPPPLNKTFYIVLCCISFCSYCTRMLLQNLDFKRFGLWPFIAE